jgi:hypothetical protein
LFESTLKRRLPESSCSPHIVCVLRSLHTVVPVVEMLVDLSTRLEVV